MSDVCLPECDSSEFLSDLTTPDDYSSAHSDSSERVGEEVWMCQGSPQRASEVARRD